MSELKLGGMNVREIKPIDFIKSLRESDPYIELIYMNGGCYQFYKVLKTMYPDARPVITVDVDHVATVIDGVIYDITGHAKGLYQIPTEEEIKMCKKWSFSRNYFLTKVCRHCAEDIPDHNLVEV